MTKMIRLEGARLKAIRLKIAELKVLEIIGVLKVVTAKMIRAVSFKIMLIILKKVSVESIFP